MAYDAIVIGVGGMGSAALYQLASRGLQVLGIEQFGIAHDRGSSHGHSRIIRKSYFEHPAYVPLLHRTYALWAELEQRAQKKLFQRAGLLLVGPEQGQVISGVRQAAGEHDLEIEDVPIGALGERFRGFSADSDMSALFEADAGYLRVEECVRTSAEQAVAHGAELLTAEPLRAWRAVDDHVVVDTRNRRLSARKLIVCAGAWTRQVLGDLNLPLEVRRKVVLWYSADEIYREEQGCPVFGFEREGHFFYGFPMIDNEGIKVAEHTGGKALADPDQVDRNLHAEDRGLVESFLQNHLTAVRGRPLRHEVCMYTMTPDEHFIVDRHPRYEHVFYAAGFSGHGFKFAPIIGSVLADWVVHGRTDEPVGFLSASRVE